MRASVLRGGRMVYRDDLPEPAPGPGQVLVAVKACGICGSDLHFAKHGAKCWLRLRSWRHARHRGRVDLGADVFMGRVRAEILDAGPGTKARAGHPGRRSRCSCRGRPEMIVYSNSTLGGCRADRAVGAASVAAAQRLDAATPRSPTDGRRPAYVNKSAITRGETRW
jgi:hypothetical protein